MKLKDISKAILPTCGRRSGRCQGYLPYLQGGPAVPASPGGRAGPGVPSLQVGHQIRWGPATWMISINSGYLLDISNVQSIAEAISVKRKRIYLYGSRKRVVFFFLIRKCGLEGGLLSHVRNSSSGMLHCIKT